MLSIENSPDPSCPCNFSAVKSDERATTDPAALGGIQTPNFSIRYKIHCSYLKMRTWFDLVMYWMNASISFACGAVFCAGSECVVQFVSFVVWKLPFLGLISCYQEGWNLFPFSLWFHVKLDVWCCLCSSTAWLNVCVVWHAIKINMLMLFRPKELLFCVMWQMWKVYQLWFIAFLIMEITNWLISCFFLENFSIQSLLMWSSVEKKN